MAEPARQDYPTREIIEHHAEFQQLTRVQRPLCVQQQLRTTCQKMKPRSPRALLPLQSADGAASAAIGLPT